MTSEGFSKLNSPAAAQVAESLRGLDIGAAAQVAESLRGLNIGAAAQVAESLRGLDMSAVGVAAESLRGLDIGAAAQAAESLRGLDIGAAAQVAESLRGLDMSAVGVAAESLRALEDDSSDRPVFAEPPLFPRGTDMPADVNINLVVRGDAVTQEGTRESAERLIQTRVEGNNVEIIIDADLVYSWKNIVERTVNTTLEQVRKERTGEAGDEEGV